ncbi:hypothetical protein STEG23_013456, partial [Scotinomys teguina]
SASTPASRILPCLSSCPDFLNDEQQLRRLLPEHIYLGYGRSRKDYALDLSWISHGDGCLCHLK